MCSNHKLNEKYYKFPCELRNKLMQKEIDFPKGIKFDYEPILAYRAVERKKGDCSEITRKDFESYFEMRKIGKIKKFPRGKKCYDDLSAEEKSSYFAVSFYMEKERVEQVLYFPKPNKKIIVGNIKKEGGPQNTNDDTKHVDWWLYEDAEIKDFEFVGGE